MYKNKNGLKKERIHSYILLKKTFCKTFLLGILLKRIKYTTTALRVLLDHVTSGLETKHPRQLRNLHDVADVSKLKHKQLIEVATTKNRVGRPVITAPNVQSEG